MNVKKKSGLWAAILVAFAGGVNAQETQSSTSGDAADVRDDPVLEEVLVTSSATRLASGFESPKPTTTIDIAEIDARGLSNIADIINELPSFHHIATPQANTIGGSNTAQNVLNFRALGSSRALILIDKRRSVAGFFGGVDINTVPQMLVKQIEVVTGGASAQWGSDAISGVVNIQQDRSLEGGKFVLRYGQTSHGDAEDKSGSFAYGFSFSDGRGHLTVGGDYQDNKGIHGQSERDWSARSWGLIGNPENTGPNDGIPDRIVADNVVSGLVTAGGYLPAILGNHPAVAEIYFGPGGEILPYDSGVRGGGFTFFQQGGDGDCLACTTSLMTPLERKSVAGLFDFEISDNLNFFLDLSYAESEANNEIVAPWNLIFWGTDVIFADNPFIPAELQTTMAENEIGFLVMSRTNDDHGFITDKTKSETTRIATGLQGDAGNWSWEAYYTHGEAKTQFLSTNNPIGALRSQAVDAVTDPTSGEIVCRANANGANGAPGCVPANVFGDGSVSQASLDYFIGAADARLKVKQDVVAASMQGEVFDLPAGPIAVAFGLEYRKEKGSVDYDEIGQSFGYYFGGGTPVSGDFNVKEAFVEVGVPVFKSARGVRLDVNGAVRYADYSASGGVWPWQIGATLGFTDDFKLRGTFSRDIRAPSINELFRVESLFFQSILNPDTGERAQTRIIGGGNPDLDVERAKTFTAGFVWQPSAADSFALSVDYFSTEITDAIGGLAAQSIVDNCFEFDIACENVEIVNGSIVEVRSGTINVGQRSVEGIDFEATYGMDNVGGGDLTFRLLASHYFEVSLASDGVNVIDEVGVVGSDSLGGTPSWRGNISADYLRGAFGLTANLVYVDGGELINDATPEDINDNTVSSQTVFNLGFRYNLAINGGRNLQLFAGIDNVFDQDPPIAPSDFLLNWSSNPIVFNLIGRNYYGGIRFDF